VRADSVGLPTCGEPDSKLGLTRAARASWRGLASGLGAGASLERNDHEVFDERAPERERDDLAGLLGRQLGG
jgi:hypothetical protein